MVNDQSAAFAGQHGIARLTAINLQLLAEGDQHESQKLFDAAQADGIFYLHLENASGTAELSTAEKLLFEAEKYFRRPLEEKMVDRQVDEIYSRTAGYKPIATETGVCDGTKDGFEAFKVSSNALFGSDNIRAAEALGGFCSDIRTVETFGAQSHHISNIIMGSLWRSLGCDDGSFFPSHHCIGLPSSSSIVVNHYPTWTLPDGSSIGHNAHTDLGSITLLFCTTWGLQVYSAEVTRWLFVPPVPGMAVVNIGDTLRFLSGNRVQSCLHRVIRHPEWTSASRLSLAYFARPNADVKFVDGEGNAWAVEDWVARKFQSYQESHTQQRENWIQMGRKGFAASVAGGQSDEDKEQQPGVPLETSEASIHLSP